MAEKAFIRPRKNLQKVWNTNNEGKGIYVGSKVILGVASELTNAINGKREIDTTKSEPREVKVDFVSSETKPNIEATMKSRTRDVEKVLDSEIEEYLYYTNTPRTEFSLTLSNIDQFFDTLEEYRTGKKTKVVSTIPEPVPPKVDPPRIIEADPLAVVE